MRTLPPINLAVDLNQPLDDRALNALAIQACCNSFDGYPALLWLALHEIEPNQFNIALGLLPRMVRSQIFNIYSTPAPDPAVVDAETIIRMVNLTFGHYPHWFTWQLLQDLGWKPERKAAAMPHIPDSTIAAIRQCQPQPAAIAA